MIFEPPPPKSRFENPIKLLVGSVVLFLLSIGLCGIGATSHNGVQSFLVGSGLVALVGSGVVCLIAIVWIIIAAFMPVKPDPPTY